MSVWAQYKREDPYLEGETIEDEVVSHDYGPKYACAARLSLMAPTGRVVLERAVCYNCQGPDGEMDVGTVGDNMNAIFTDSPQSWCWEPATAIVSERQVDDIQAVVSAGSKRRYRPPINKQMYCLLQQMTMDRAVPAFQMSSTMQAFLESKGVDPFCEELQERDLKWVPRSGTQKTGLDDCEEGVDRKDVTLIMGPRVMRENKDEAAAAWTDGLQRIKSQPKPKEDVCDAYLQGHRYLMDQLAQRQKEGRKAERTAAAQAKREEKEARRIAREHMQLEKKRMRDSFDDAGPSKKRKKTVKEPAPAPIVKSDADSDVELVV